MGNGKKTLIDLSKGSKTNYQEMYDSSLRQKTRKTPQVIELRKALNRQREPEFINYSNRARVVNVRPEVSHVHIPAYGGVQFIPETRDVGSETHNSDLKLGMLLLKHNLKLGDVATETRDVGIGTQSETRDVATETQPETGDVGTDMIQSNISFDDWQRQAIQQQIQPSQQHRPETGVDKSMKKTYQCPYCVYVTSRKRTLERHIQSLHKIYHCSDCPYTTQGEYFFKRHCQSIHGFTPIQPLYLSLIHISEPTRPY